MPNNLEIGSRVRYQDKNNNILETGLLCAIDYVNNVAELMYDTVFYDVENIKTYYPTMEVPLEFITPYSHE